MKCHLAYSVPSTGTIFKKGARRLREGFQGMGLPISLIGRRDRIDTRCWPASSPYTITANLYRAFSQRMPTLLYHLTEKVRCDFDVGDIFVGHPYFPYSEGSRGVTELSAESRIRPRVFAIMSPLHCNLGIQTNHINKDYLESIDRLFPMVDVLFGIMGQYWADKWKESPYSHWLSKLVRVDMAIDVGQFPRVKHHFNPPGKRGYLYIGRNDPMKGIDILRETMQMVGDHPKGWIGSGAEIPGIPRISQPRRLSVSYMARIAKHFDFFVTTGVADPNPTTILECMSWGFPVICTPQSGYYETDYLLNIPVDDPPQAAHILRQLQFAPEDKLASIADLAREVVRTRYSWSMFAHTVISTIVGLAAGEGRSFC